MQIIDGLYPESEFMAESYWPVFGSKNYESGIPKIGYLDWYVPRLEENRPHNLSLNGMQYDWDIKEIMEESIFEIANHHIGNLKDPRINVSNRERVDVERVVICHGATQGLHIAICAALANNSDKTVTIAVESPCYAPIVQSPQLFNHEVIKVRRLKPKDSFGHWRIDKQKWLQAIQKSKILMITPILNPSGWDYHSDDREWIVNTCKEHNVIIIADEVYLDTKRRHEEYLPFYKLGEHCISINSLTKVYSLGTIRFGWIIASPKIAEQARRAFITLGGMMGSPTLRIAESVFPHLDIALDKVQEYREKNLPLLRRVLERFDIIWNEPSHGLFGAFKLPYGINAIDFIDRECKNYGVLLVPGNMFEPDLDEWVRVAWSIEPKLFEKAIINLEKALDLAISQKTSQ